SHRPARRALVRRGLAGLAVAVAARQLDREGQDEARAGLGVVGRRHVELAAQPPSELAADRQPEAEAALAAGARAALAAVEDELAFLVGNARPAVGDRERRLLAAVGRSDADRLAGGREAQRVVEQ